MRKLLGALVVAAMSTGAAGLTSVNAQNAPEPYKLGMFRQGNRTFPGMVVRDSMVVELGGGQSLNSSFRSCARRSPARATRSSFPPAGRKSIGSANSPSSLVRPRKA